ncbi:hypothetical protein AAFC00_000977 [Neodothiora populina]|uniref:Uncharacterized protein n=1 Tax=Neodothiora populina TaxID=2781224 RepID=A0ABR3PMD6_9PEZI
MFCTSLRRRPSISAAVSSLTSAPLRLKESQLDTHDVAISVPHQTSQSTKIKTTRQIVRFLLLSSASVAEENMSTTFARIRRFASLTGGTGLAIVMLLQRPTASSSSNITTRTAEDHVSNTSSVHAYVKLQAELFTMRDIPYLPMLPLAELASLSSLLDSYVSGLRQSQQQKEVKPAMTAVSLLPYCTTNPPLSPFAVSMTTDIFSSLRAIASEAMMAVNSNQEEFNPDRSLPALSGDSDDIVMSDNVAPGLAALAQQIGSKTVREMVAFWEEEWSAD